MTETFRSTHSGIIGPNGADKLTVLKTLSRITRPTAGRVAIILADDL